MVKYYSAATTERIAAQMRVAAERSPDQGLDLSAMNLADVSAVFRRAD